VTRVGRFTLCFSGLLTGAPDPRDRGPESIDVSDYPQQYKESYELFKVRCSKCHSVARGINARLRPDEWRLYVKKMARRPGSGINPETGDRIAEFLTYYSQRRDAPPSGDGGVP
jgi:hypothetical protein